MKTTALAIALLLTGTAVAQTTTYTTTTTQPELDVDVQPPQPVQVRAEPVGEGGEQRVVAHVGPARGLQRVREAQAHGREAEARAHELASAFAALPPLEAVVASNDSRKRSMGRKVVEALGGQGGGGRPDLAQGGGPDGNQAAEAIQAVRDAGRYLGEVLAGCVNFFNPGAIVIGAPPRWPRRAGGRRPRCRR